MNDIFRMIEQEETKAKKSVRKALIINPGAVGDCILTLPLATFLKDSLGIGEIVMIGCTDYIDFYPSRSCVDRIRSINSIDFYRFFVDHSVFRLDDNDPLLQHFSDYEIIISFMGESNSEFERNLIFTVNCNRSAEVFVLPVIPPAKLDEHISRFYIHQFAASICKTETSHEYSTKKTYFSPRPSDLELARETLCSAGISLDKKLILIHPGSGGDEKCWHVDNFLSVAELLKNQNAEIIFLLGPAEMDRLMHGQVKKLNDIGHCLSQIDLTCVFQVLQHCTLFLGNDSGISHLSGASGIRTIAMFGPTDSTVYQPLGPDVHILKPDSNSFKSACSHSSGQVAAYLSKLLKN